MDAVEEIKSRLSIEDVVSQYLELKRSGRNFKALSPFSKEKTPSLMISPEKQIWHDFSSGKGGDMISFVMEMDGLDFKAALEVLARQAGVDLEQFKKTTGKSSGVNKEELFTALELAAKFYQVHLSKHKPTLDYVLKTRGYSKETILTFKLGYSPNQDTALVTFLRGKGIKDTVIKQAGLATQRYRGFSDMFINRLMVPLQDSTGRVIGFTARQLSDDKNSPKYINTPQSPVYDKSRHVYGLHLAKDAIRKSDFVVVAEGNLDVIGSYQAGVQNIVATAGTAITDQHLKAMSRFTGDVRLAFDQDEAGLKATERAIPIAAKVGVNLSIITVPEGKDPDEIAKNDPSAWKEAVNKPAYAVDWIIERYTKLLDLGSAIGKKKFSDQVIKVIDQLSDSVEKDHYLIKIARILDVGVDSLRQKSIAMHKPDGPKAKLRTQNISINSQVTTDMLKAQNKILALGLMLPSLRKYLDPMTRDMFYEDRAKKLLDFLKSNLDYNYQEEGKGLLPELADYGKILALLYEELYQSLEVIELRYEAARLQIRQIETYVKTQKDRLARALMTSNEADTGRLLEAAKRLDVLLKTAKETTR